MSGRDLFVCVLKPIQLAAASEGVTRGFIQYNRRTGRRPDGQMDNSASFKDDETAGRFVPNLYDG